jgi:predicted RNA-binding Zn-ribbon protein involved in translation (DUF1610 family)
MPVPVCVTCNRKLRPVQFGVSVMFNATRRIVDQPPTQVPYQAFQADKFKCDSCGTETITRYASKPFWGAWMGEKTPVTDYSIPESDG